MGKGEIGHGDGKGGCGCCCGPVDCKAPDPANTPRSVTDIIFLLAFIAFWVGMIACASIGLSNGDLTRLLYFVDYNGNRCGTGDLIDHKYVHWTHWTNAGTNVCVEKCPTDTDMFTLTGANVSMLNGTDTDLGYKITPDTSSATCTSTYFMGCIDSVQTANALAKTADDLLSKASCCPFADSPAPGGLYVCVPTSVGNATSYAKEYVDSFSTMMASATGDLITGWYIILCSALIALVMSFVWSYILKYSAGCFVWSCVALSNLTLLAMTGISYYMYDKYTVLYEETGVSNDEQMSYLMLVSLAICGVASFCLLCMTVCMCKQIRIAVGIIEAACEAVQTMPMIVFFPLISYFIMIVFQVYWILIAAMMASAGEYKKDSLTGAYLMEWDDTTQKAALYHFFGLLWTMAFIRHMTILILAGAFGVWYWTSLPDKEAGKFHEIHRAPILSSVKRSVCYHTGTVAFGSFIIAVIQFMQACLEYIKRKQDSKLLKYIISCVQCLMKCFEKLMEYVSKCAYIVTACKGNMFCTAAMASFGFLFKHMGQHIVVQWISEFLMALGKMFILCSTVGICFVMAGAESELSSPYLVLIVCALIAYLVACLFLGVFDVAIDTILVCFCWEKDANGAMENAEGEKMVYGTMGLVKFIDGAQKMAAEVKAGNVAPSTDSAPVTEVAPAPTQGS